MKKISLLFALSALLFSLTAHVLFAESGSGGFQHPFDTPSELIVRLHRETSPDTSKETLAKLSKRFGALSVRPVFDPMTPAGRDPRLRLTYIVRFPKGHPLAPLQRTYQRHPAVEAVEPNRLSRPCAGSPPTDPQYAAQWNLNVLNIQETWQLQRGSPAVTVAVVDSGIASRHPDLVSQRWVNGGEVPRNGVDDDRNGYVDDTNGWDFSDAPTLAGSGDSTVRDNDPEDESGHGTHVSGIIAAQTDNGIGVAGVAPHCRLMPLRAGFTLGGGTYFQNDDLAAAIVYAADNGAAVINMSWGDTVRAFLIADAVAYAASRGCVLVGAAGNAAAPGSVYPAALESVISVAGIGPEKQLWPGSNFGATVQIAAPGEAVLSTALNGTYQERSGTSMAAAHVSGIAALLLSANREATPADVRETLLARTAPLFVRELVGAGVLDGYAALTATTPLIATLDVVQNPDAETDRIDIFGSAGGAGFTAYRLEYGIGEVPDLWYPLGTLSTTPTLQTCLHRWDTADLAEGRYTLRLRVDAETGETVRVKKVVDVNRTAPLLLKHDARPWLVGDRFHPVVMWETETWTTGQVELFLLDGTPERTLYSDSENRVHRVDLVEAGVAPGTYLYRLVMRKRAGATERDDNNGQFYRITVEDAPIHGAFLAPVATFVETDGSLHGIASPVDINGNQELAIFAVDTVSGEVSAFESTDAESHAPIFAFTTQFWPWTTADTDNDGLVEILGIAGGTTFLLEQPRHGEFPSVPIWEAPRHWGRTIADADADGTPEIFARNDTTHTISVYEATGDNTYRTTATLENPTSGQSGLSPNVVTGDFDGDGQVEILAADTAGTVFIYETNGDDRYRRTWIHTSPEGTPQLLAAGDMDGDGKAEFAVCAKAGTDIGGTLLDIRYYYWVVTVFAAAGDDTYQAVWTQRIRDLQESGNGMTIADANSDGRNELCIATAPNFYLVRHDGTAYRVIWHQQATSTFNPIVADLNGDGAQSLLFNSESRLTRFEVPGAGSPFPGPIGLRAHPMDERSVSLKWHAVPGTASYTLYRGEDAPPLEKVREGLREPAFTDTGLTAGATYRYTVASRFPNGTFSARSDVVSVVPTRAPRLLEAVLSPPNRLLLTFDKPMGPAAAHTGQYRLYKQDALENDVETDSPRSAVLDRTAKRVVLTFSPALFRTGTRYRIEASHLTDRDGTPLAADAQALTVELPAPTLAEVIVYPNPAETCDRVMFDRLPAGTDIHIYDAGGNCIAALARTDYERDMRVWELAGLSSGIYIYVLSSGTERQLGKIAVVR